MINPYAKLCNACAKGDDFTLIGHLVAQLQAQLDVTLPAAREAVPILASTLLPWH
jgi:hypothetical protein